MLINYVQRIRDIEQMKKQQIENFYPHLGHLLYQFARKCCHKNLKVNITRGQSTPAIRIYSDHKLIGYVEAVLPGNLMNVKESSERFQKDLRSLNNLIITDFYTFRLYKSGRLIDSISIKNHLIFRTREKEDVEKKERFFQMLDIFFTFPPVIIDNVELLCSELAKRGRFIKKTFSQELMVRRVYRQPFAGFFRAKDSLCTEPMSREEFIDLSAQLIPLFLFEKWLLGEKLTASHICNSFLKSYGLIKEIGSFIMSNSLESRLEWILQEIIIILNNTQKLKIVSELIKKENDISVNLYIQFISHYGFDSEKKIDIFSIYINSYLFRAVQRVLKLYFDKEELADTRVILLDSESEVINYITQRIRPLLGESIQDNTNKKPRLPRSEVERLVTIIMGERADYLQILRQAVQSVEQGVVALIVDQNFLESAEYKGIRYSLLNSFKHMYFLSIPRYGISLALFVKKTGLITKVFHTSVNGSKEELLKWLKLKEVSSIDWIRIYPDSSNYTFAYCDYKLIFRYNQFISISQFFADILPDKSSEEHEVYLHSGGRGLSIQINGAAFFNATNGRFDTATPKMSMPASEWLYQLSYTPQTVNPEILRNFEKQYQKQVRVEDISYYIYSFGFCEEFNRRYGMLITTDSIRVPIPKEYELFRQMVRLGELLRNVHLLDVGIMANPAVNFIKNDSEHRTNNRILYHKVENRVYLKDEIGYFEPISIEEWNFQLRGQRVLKEWVQKRLNRGLALEEIEEFCRIATVVHYTVMIKKKIDRLFLLIEEQI